jgi:membrane protein DedA with SNARE-associated domain
LISQIETWILGMLHALFDAWGWGGVAVMMAFENLTGITPSEVVLALAGWMLISEHQLPASVIFLGGLYAALGSVVGASGAYWMARLGGRPLVDRLARWVRLQPVHITRAEQQFNRWGAGLVLVGRLVPGIRTLVSIPAGLARLNFLKFLAATFIGAYFWCTLLISAGYLLGHEWSLISNYVKQGLPYLLFAGLLAMGVYLWLARRVLAAAWARIGTTIRRPLENNSTERSSFMDHSHSSVSRSPRWRRWLPRSAAAGAGGTALVIWFEELIAFATEFIGVIFLPVLAGILFLFDHFVFKSAMPQPDDKGDVK